MSSKSIRISEDLFSMATATSDIQSRSVAQQVEHWARLGAAMEAANPGAQELTRLLEGGSPLTAEPAQRARAR